MTQNICQWQKIPLILPLLVNDNFIINLFNIFFGKQFQLPENISTLPKYFMYHTENRLNGITFDNKKLLRIIQSSDANKAHVCLSIRVLKLSSPSIMKPLSVTFLNFLISSIFPNIGKKEALCWFIKEIVHSQSIIIARVTATYMFKHF